MKNYSFYWKGFLIVFILASFFGCSNSSVDKPWNVLFILADDLGWNQVGYHGSVYYETPNIDRIAADGITFSNAYSANPVCSPTRSSIMTGKNPARLHLTNYIPGSPYPYAKLITPQMAKSVPLEELTLAEMFKEMGYMTGHFGKWHLSPDKNYSPGRIYDPASQGFDDVFTSVKPKEDADPSADAHHAIEITDRAIAFMEENKNKPFFAYVAHHVVHRPVMEKPDLVTKYEDKPGTGDPANNPIMGAMIETMDIGIGRLLAKLEELNLTEHTIVIFYSDNGGFEQLQDQAPFRGGKAMIFEGGIRVPLAIKWPGVVTPGTTSSSLVISDDFFPTLADIIGYENLPGNLDGMNLEPLLTEDIEPDRQTLFFHYPHYHHQGYMPAGAIREGDLKLIEWFEASVSGEGKAYQLFDLSVDISEENDLSDLMPEKVAEMAEKLNSWRSDLGAQEMIVNPGFDPEKADWRTEESETE